MAAFRDCHPFAVTTSGRMAIGFKKISPGGHWMNIGRIATKKARLISIKRFWCVGRGLYFNCFAASFFRTQGAALSKFK
jgi:hypothetical protein